MTDTAGQLRIEVEAGPRGTIVHLIGRGDLSAAEALTMQLNGVLEAQPKVIVVDMSGLTFASSLVMGALVTLKGRARKHGGAVRLAALQPLVAQAFEAARLDWALPVFDTVDAALAAD